MMIPEEKKPGYITLKEASERFGYSQDYLGQLIRKGKLEGKLVYSHVAWVTTPEAIEQYLSENKKKKSKNDDPKDIPATIKGEESREGIYTEEPTPMVAPIYDVTPADSSRLLFVSFRLLLLVAALLGIFIFSLLITALDSYLRTGATTQSASVIFAASSHGATITSNHYE